LWARLGDAGWTAHGGTRIRHLAVARNADGRPEFFAEGDDAATYTKYQLPNGSWTDWEVW